MVKRSVGCKIKFTSRKALSDNVIYSKAILLLCSKVKVFFKIIIKTGVISTIGLKETIPKTREQQVNQVDQ